MKHIVVNSRDYQEVNQEIRSTKDKNIVLSEVFGQRYLGSSLKDRELTIEGTAGNALGCFLDGGIITVHGNAQDATGDTMNDGKIVIHGSCGDGTGLAMRGGAIYIRDSSGYRSGIHILTFAPK